MTVEQALALIPGKRDVLNRIDNELQDVIRFVEHVLAELKIGVPIESTYETTEGKYILTWCKWDAKWQILWGREADDDGNKDVPLVGSPRHVRSEVFMVGASGLSPIEELIVNAVNAIEGYAQERVPQLEVARRLSAVLAKAGFTDARSA